MQERFGQLGPALPMFAITLLLVVMFMTYQISGARRRAREALTRDRRPRSRLRRTADADIDSQIQELMLLRDRGRIDERTYYEVLRRLTSGERR